LPRLDTIAQIRRRLEAETQSLPEGDISGRVGKLVQISAEPLKRRILRHASGPILHMLQKRVRREVEFELSFHADALTIGERFANDMALQKLLDRLGPVTKKRVLIVGCYIGGEDVQFWLRRGVAALDGVDVYDLTATWQEVTPVLAAR
jgi:hypothetical protein